jgi:hypothetical protein
VERARANGEIPRGASWETMGRIREGLLTWSRPQWGGGRAFRNQDGGRACRNQDGGRAFRNQDGGRACRIGRVVVRSAIRMAVVRSAIRMVVVRSAIGMAVVPALVVDYQLCRLGSQSGIKFDHMLPHSGSETCSFALSSCASKILRSYCRICGRESAGAIPINSNPPKHHRIGLF